MPLSDRSSLSWPDSYSANARAAATPTPATAPPASLAAIGMAWKAAMASLTLAVPGPKISKSRPLSTVKARVMDPPLAMTSITDRPTCCNSISLEVLKPTAAPWALWASVPERRTAACAPVAAEALSVAAARPAWALVAAATPAVLAAAAAGPAPDSIDGLTFLNAAVARASHFSIAVADASAVLAICSSAASAAVSPEVSARKPKVARSAAPAAMLMVKPPLR